jgi:hypothetical protein
MRKVNFIVITLIVLCGLLTQYSCNKRLNKISSEDELIRNSNENYMILWKKWLFSYGSGKYIADYQPDSLNSPLRVIFWGNNDSTFIGLFEQDSLNSKVYIRNLLNNPVWNANYKTINFKHFEFLIEFIDKNNIEYAKYGINPERVNFRRFHSKIEYMYLYNLQDTNQISKDYKMIVPHWYTFGNSINSNQ